MGKYATNLVVFPHMQGLCGNKFQTRDELSPGMDPEPPGGPGRDAKFLAAPYF